MVSYARELYDQLLYDIDAIKEESITFIEKAQKILNQTVSVLEQLHIEIQTYKFKDDAEEIAFFKYSLPAIMALYFEYTIKRNIEIGMPVGSIRAQRNHIEQELITIEHFFYYNHELYRYYRSESMDRDSEYFLRKFNTDFTVDVHFFLINKQFTTLNSTKIAAIIASEQIKNYLNSMLDRFDHPELTLSPTDFRPLKWTDSKTNLIELIYALYSSGSYNNGKAELREIIDYYQKNHSVDLGNTSRTFQEILRRKGGQTNFLDRLKNKLQQYIDKIDQKYFTK